MTQSMNPRLDEHSLPELLSGLSDLDGHGSGKRGVQFNGHLLPRHLHAFQLRGHLLRGRLQLAPLGLELLLVLLERRLGRLRPVDFPVHYRCNHELSVGRVGQQHGLEQVLHGLFHRAVALLVGARFGMHVEDGHLPEHHGVIIAIFTNSTDRYKTDNLQNPNWPAALQNLLNMSKMPKSSDFPVGTQNHFFFLILQYIFSTFCCVCACAKICVDVNLFPAMWTMLCFAFPTFCAGRRAGRTVVSSKQGRGRSSRVQFLSGSGG